MNGLVPAEDGLHTAGALNAPKALNGAPPCIKIDKGVPLPGARSINGKYPLAKMEVGDSFAVPCAAGNQATLRRAVSAWCARHSVKMAARAVMENGERVIRVWRVS